MQQADASPTTVAATPQPGFVIKTWDATGAKVFINVCTSSQIALPPMWETTSVPPSVLAFLTDEDDEAAAPSPEVGELLKFPSHLTDVRIEADRSNEPSSVLDFVVHPLLVEQGAACRPLKLYIIQVALAAVEKKVGQLLDSHYKLPKMRYKGVVPPATIQIPKIAAVDLVTEVPVPTPMVKYLGRPRASVVEVSVPLETADDRAEVWVQGEHVDIMLTAYPDRLISVDLPVAVTVREGTFEYDAQKKALVAQLPIVPVQQLLLKE